MGYENAKTTRLLATHCCCCGRPLVDAKSVEIGIGPDCRKKYGHDELGGLDEATRTLANKLVYEAAAINEADPARVIEIAETLAAMGLLKLPEKLVDRFIRIKLMPRKDKRYRWDGAKRREVEEDVEIAVVEVFAPYNADFTNALKAAKARGTFQYLRPRRDDNGRFACWQVDRDSSRALLGIVCKHFAGQKAVGSKGVFVVPSIDDYEATFAKPRMEAVPA